MAEEVEKVQPGRGRVTDLSVQVRNPNTVGYRTQWNMGNGPAGGYTPGINLGNGADWFGPLNPQAPSAPPEVAGRRLDFPSGFNLNLEPRAYKPIKFSDLRALAENYDVLRTIIETRKDQVCRLKWNIKPRENAHGKKLMKPNDPLLDEIREFFEMPDGHHFWDAWLRMLLEDLFVVDAPALFCRRNRGGKLLALDNIDGATFKIIIDDWGRIPEPPIPAYQQSLHGLPALNYTTRDIIYRPRNMRAHEIYGYSPVEQIIMSVNIALRREVFLLQYYTEGNIPEALIGVPENWTPNQIETFQTWFDSILAGETANRRHARFVPGGIGKTYINTKEGALTGETDEWLTRIMCFAFSVSPTPFIRQVNRATAESQKQAATEEGLAPIQQWIKSLVDYVIRKEFNCTTAEFGWEIPDDVDAEKQGKILTDYVKTGVFSINMALDKLGEDPIEGGDQHLALLPTGWVPIAPTNQFGAQGGSGGAGEVNDDLKAEGNQRLGNTPPKDVTPPPDPNARKPQDPSRTVSTTENPAKGAGLATKTPFGKRASNLLVDVERPEVTALEAEIAKIVREAFEKCNADVGPHVLASLRQLGKASLFDGPIAKRIVESLDFSALTDAAANIASKLSNVASGTAKYIMQSFGMGRDATTSAMQDATQKAVARGGNLVDQRYDPAMDEFFAEPGADMSIIPTTSGMIENLIQQGVDGSLTPEGVVEAIAEGVFSDYRVEMIANAESSRAVSFGVEASSVLLADNGKRQKKAWVTVGDDRVCTEICAQNELDGAIEMDAEFSSGDKWTPGHPKCRCSMMLVEA